MANTKLMGGIGLVAVIVIAGFMIVPLLFPSSDTIKISGSGSSFINPLMQQWSEEYNTNIDSKVQIDYASVGSGTGIKDVTAGTVDFGASDAPLKADEFTALNDPLHIPMTVGGITIAYNIPSAPDALQLNGSVIADIFMGVITKWNDPKIVELNTNSTFDMPDHDIVLQVRSDSSGTTFGFTDYLSHVSSTWNSTNGVAKLPSWPTGTSQGKGNEGVTANIQSTDYSIGYIELAYAQSSGLHTIAIENQEGNFKQATTAGIQAALTASATSLPKGEESWSDVSLVNAPGADSYAICSFTYVIVHKDLSINMKDLDSAQALLDFLWWGVHDGQSFASPLSYVPLSQAVVDINVRTLGLLTFGTESLTLPSA